MAKEIYIGTDGFPIVEDRGVKDGKRVVTDTSKMMKEDPLMALDFIKCGKDAIPAQERAGQVELINSDTMPTKCNSYDVEGEKVLIALGFKLGKEVEGDAMFRYMELPKGWKKEGGSHAMWSYILDADGNERLSIFYKAAFYDRSAHYNLTKRFYSYSEYVGEGQSGDDSYYEKSQYMIKDKCNPEKPLCLSAVLDRGDYDFDDDARKKAYYDALDAAGRESKAQLKVYFPDYENPAAYWGKEGDDIIENNGLRK